MNAMREQKPTVRRSAAHRALTLSLIATVVVVVIKLVTASISGSISVLAEGLQSSVDVTMAIASLATLSYALKPPDAGHPYGHGKAAFILSAAQMLLILASAAWILWFAYRRILNPAPIHWDWGAAGMAYSTLSNTFVVAYLRKVDRMKGNALVRSEITHLWSDSLATSGVLIGLLLVGLTGWLWLDPIVAIVFTSIAMVIAYQQLRRVIHPLMDGALPIDEVDSLKAILDSHPQVRGFHNLRTRQTGDTRFVDLHLMLDDALPFVEAHEIAEQIESELRDRLGGGVVTVHYEPFEAERAHRARAHAEDLNGPA